MDELKNKFGNAVWWISTSWYEAAGDTVPAIQSMMIFNSWTTAGNIQQMTRTFRSDNRNRRNFYQQSNEFVIHCEDIDYDYHYISPRKKMIIEIIG